MMILTCGIATIAGLVIPTKSLAAPPDCDCSGCCEITPECATFRAWQPGLVIATGHLLSRRGVVHRCVDGSRCGNANFDPAVVANPAVWSEEGMCLTRPPFACDRLPPAWLLGKAYTALTQVVGTDGDIYECRASAASLCGQSGRQPGTGATADAAWERVIECKDDGKWAPKPTTLDGVTIPTTEEISDSLVLKWLDVYGVAAEDAVYGEALLPAAVSSGHGFLIVGGAIEEVDYLQHASGYVTWGADLVMSSGEFSKSFFPTLGQASAELTKRNDAFADEQESATGFSSVGGLTSRDYASWSPGTIFYWHNLDHKFEREGLKFALAWWAAYTPFSFQEASSEQACRDSESCLLYRKAPDKICSSGIGRSATGVQEIQVSKRMFCRGGYKLGKWFHGALLHETGHALGLHHEHQRWDREQYVTFIPGNLRSGKLSDYAIDETYSHTAIDKYDIRSIMHYWNRQHGKRVLGRSKVTLAGALKMGNGALSHFNEMRSTDIVGVLTSNFSSHVWISDNKEFFGRNRRLGGSPTGMWQTYKSDRWGGIANNAIAGIVVPPDAEVVAFANSSGDLTTRDNFDFGVWRSGDFDSEVRSNISRLLIRPAVSIATEAGYNEALSSLDVGDSLASELDPWLSSRGYESVAVGPGLQARICGAGEPFTRCRAFDTGRHSGWPEQAIDGALVAKVRVQLAVTVWNRSRFIGSWGPHAGRSRVESFPYQLSDAGVGQLAFYRPANFRQIRDNEISSLYVPPATRAILCPNEQPGPTCQFFSPGAYTSLGTLDNAISYVQVDPAVTVFAESGFDFAGNNQTFVLGTYTGSSGLNVVGDNAISSIIVAPGLVARVCDNSAGTTACQNYGGAEGARVTNLSTSLDNKVSYLRVSAWTP